jgi:PadR family transcriptional regulator, regulatory protein PadR
LNNDTQIMKGILEGCLLKIVENGEIYGYKAVEKLNAFGFEVNEATVYPILTRLQNKEYLKIDKRPSPYGPMRKYYTLTETGEGNLNEFMETWKRIKNIVTKIMENDKDDKKK